MRRATSLWIACLLATACESGSLYGPDGGGGGRVDGPVIDGWGDLDGNDCPAPQRCNGVCCGPTGSCIDDACCPAERACGAVCCAEGDTCQGGECRTFCGATAPPPCGPTGTEECCPVADVCYREDCTTPGDPCDDVYDCGRGFYCEETLGKCLPLPDEITCTLPTPPAGVFTPAIQWEWSGSSVVPDHDQVMMQPAVADLTSDGVPEVVFSTFKWRPESDPTLPHGNDSYREDGVLRAVRGDTGVELWNVTAAEWRVCPAAPVAIADIDKDNRPEILVCGTKTAAGAWPLLAFEHDGTPKWKTTDARVVCGYSGPSVGDTNGDGTPEILLRYTLLRNDGSVLVQAAATSTGFNDDAKFTTLADLNNDGGLDIVGGNRAFERDGTLLWDKSATYADGPNAVADLDLDGDPDVVLVQTTAHTIMAFDGRTGAPLWPSARDINQGQAPVGDEWGGGPPTIADFDGDGKPEVAAAAGYGYVVFEGENGAPKWFKQTTDRSSRQTGSSVFDFEGDGRAEVVYNDEKNLHIYDGTTGNELFKTCNTSGTLFEYPVIVDLDNDDRAEILVARNNYIAYAAYCDDGTPSKTGLAVYRDVLDNWVRTRTVWNEHTYHVTNIGEDSSVPAAEAPNWTVAGLNNFRQNVQPWGVHVAADLVVDAVAATRQGCPTALHLEAWVRNAGDAAARPGAPIAFYRREGASWVHLGTVLTTTSILPGQTVLVAFDWPLPGDRVGQEIVFTAAADDDGTGAGPGAGQGTVRECQEGNNVGPEATGSCPYVP